VTDKTYQPVISGNNRRDVAVYTGNGIHRSTASPADSLLIALVFASSSGDASRESLLKGIQDHAQVLLCRRGRGVDAGRRGMRLRRFNAV
jgi:hypothetical protein